MIFKQTIRESLGDSLYVFSIEQQEVPVITFFNENILAVDASIVNVVVRIVE